MSVFTFLVEAAPLTLKEIEDRLMDSHPLYLTYQEKKEAHHAKMESEFASTPLVLSAGGADANPTGMDDEFEYNFGVSKSFMFGNQKKEKFEIEKLKHKAHALEFEKKLIAFSNEIKFDYHKSCFMQEQRVVFENSYHEFEKLYKKKLKAYKYKEISKKELLQLEIEKANLEQKFQNFKAKEKISKQTLFDVVGTKGTDTLSCKDIHPMVFNEDDGDKLFELSIKAYENEILAERKSVNFYNRSFESFDLSVGYDKEIDMKRYGVGVSMPLSFTSKADEYKKISALHNQKALKLQKQHMLIEKSRKFKQLKSKLDNEKDLIFMMENSINRYRDDLLPLIEKSYQFGESSVVEYLLSKQKFWQLQERLNEYKITYYKTLFELYTVAEIKEKE